ncbi:MaoC family dehydratase [Nocardia sp. NPDC005366]|uniref:MaoC family dehydratase n=1 Tax=Nocardia sp. NPDC005366 TaxID=3156878 RepID=UPI0033A76DA3
MSQVVTSSTEAVELIGLSLGPSELLVVDQNRIDLFAQATGDHQWIHVDPERAAGGPFKGTIAHGFLTVSLIPYFAAQIITWNFGTARLNYGSDRVRFPAPVPAGATLRASAGIIDVRTDVKGTSITTRFTITADGAVKPDCVADPTTPVIGESPADTVRVELS